MEITTVYLMTQDEAIEQMKEGAAFWDFDNFHKACYVALKVASGMTMEEAEEKWDNIPVCIVKGMPYKKEVLA